MAKPIMHFEIPADDVARAKKFYETVFGWKITDPWKMDYWFVETRKQGEDGINGGLMARKMPGQPFMNYVVVMSIEDALADVEGAGGTVVVPKQEIGSNMGWIACFKDTEGNIMGLHRPSDSMMAQVTGKKAAAKKAPKKAAKKSVKKAAKRKAKKKR